jgi:uncharacterized membrane protein
MNKNQINITDIVLIGLFAAVVYGGQWLRVPVPTPVGETAINLGNIFVLLAGFILGPVRGGLSAGIGSYIFNLTHPVYYSVLPFQFFFRFAHAFVCGLVAKRFKKLAWLYVAAVAGQLTYIVLFMLQRYWYNAVFESGLTRGEAAWIATAPSLPPSIVNGIVAVIIAVPLVFSIEKALGGVPLYRRFTNKTRS